MKLVASLFCSGDEVPPEDLRRLMQRSYKTFDHEEVVPSIKVNDLYVMELFHGPTFAFKDVALQGPNFRERAISSPQLPARDPNRLSRSPVSDCRAAVQASNLVVALHQGR
ncbi:unnamed protein product [Effrenium voratum]|nr:unnamed protein product [Effrenium voratum]